MPHTTDTKPAHWETMHSPAAQVLPIATAGGLLIAVTSLVVYIARLQQLIPQ